MTPFLYHTAQHLWETHGEQLSEMRIVFPNKRSALYFMRYLKEIVEVPFRVPECITINELFLLHSDKAIADKLTLCSKLYKSYKKTTKTAEDFPEFYPFANLLLGDFDAIDRHLVDTKQLFQNIASLKAIDNTLSYLTEEQLAAIQQFWSTFDVKKHSQQQQLFLQMWKALPKVYKDFNQTLETEKIAYEGRIFREVAEALKNGKSILAEVYSVFVGFNVLSKAEHEVFHLLQKQNSASFYWDCDEYLLENKHNEAGRFIVRNIRDFPNPSSFLQYRKINSQKDVVHITCTSEVQQAKVLGEMLTKLSEPQLTKTVVVLANEELLPTVLSSLPEELKSVNVSMGYPLSETPWMQFLELIVQLHKTTMWQGKTAYFSSEIVQKLLQHPYATYLEKSGIAALEYEMHNGNQAWVAAGSVKGKLQRILSPIYNEQDSYAYLKPLLGFLFAKSQLHSADRELMLRTGTLAQRIHDTLQTVAANTPQFFWTLLLKELSQQRMPFQVAKEKGLQIIGFLESRLLDFENVYILSANESYLPNISLAGSLIPYNLRIGAGLPTLDEQNAMYAYYFYRLLSGANKMTLFSVLGSEDMQCKEQSRYITQLQYEAPFDVRKMTAMSALQWVAPNPPLIMKNKETEHEFQKYFEGKRTLSASAINRYLRCPQNFYYRYIKGIEEVQNIAKADDSNMFGSIFHKAVELLYQPYVGEEISESLLRNIAKNENIERLILQAFQEELFGKKERVLRGKEWLIFDTLKHFLKQLIVRDSCYAPFTIVGLETSLEIPLQIEIAGKVRNIMLKGLIDRIDKKNGQLRIVDYKTGNINRGFTSLEGLFSACGEHRNPTALQTFLYCWLYYKHSGDLAMPCVYHLKEIQKIPNSEFQMGESRKKIPFKFEEYWQDYEDLLKKLLCEIFDSKIAFSPTDKVNECSHDAHSGICTAFGSA